MNTTLAAALATAALALLPLTAAAVNKCTGPDGKIAFQDAPCGVETKKSEAVKVWGGNKMASREASVSRAEPNLALQAHPQADALLKFYRRWADGEKLAMATSRIALAQPVASLQNLQRELEAYSAPECLRSSKAELLSLVSGNVKIMIDFMGKEEASSMIYQYLDRAKMIRAFEGAVMAARCE